MRPTKTRYLQEINRLEPAVKRAYMEWVRSRIDAASVVEVERWVRAANVAEIMRTLGITEASMSSLAESVREAYKAGGAFEAPAMREPRFTFDIRNPQAEAWLGAHSAQLVTRIANSQREAIREALDLGMQAGKNPRTTSLDIIGRRDVTGRRRGGIVGLNGPQANAAGAAWNELFSGEPSALRNYLLRERRDRRYDPMVRRAIESGSGLTQKQVNTLSGRYADRLLQLRGETIARTETIAAMNAGRNQAWEQGVEEGVVNPEYIIHRWSSTTDARTRDAHRLMNNQQRAPGDPFVSPTGALMMYPGDTSLGAGAEDVVNCRCFRETTVDFIAQEAAA